MNDKQNNLCPCGSGKKYKNCCLDRKKHLIEKHKQEIIHSLEDGSISRDLAFNCMLEIYYNAETREDFVFIYEYVDRIRKKTPEVFKKAANHLNKFSTFSATYLKEKKWVLSSISYQNPSDDIDYFNQIQDMLKYYGNPDYITPLTEQMLKKWPEVEKSSDITPYGIDEYRYNLLNLLCITAIEEYPDISKEDFFARIPSEIFIELSEEWLEEMYLQPYQRGIKSELEDILDDNINTIKESLLLKVKWSLLGYLHKRKGIPLSRGLLATHELYNYFQEIITIYEEEKNRGLSRRDLPLKELLIPNPTIIKEFIDTYNATFGGQLFGLAALIEILPLYLSYLKSFIILDQKEQLIKNIEHVTREMVEFFQTSSNTGFIFEEVVMNIKSNYQI